MVYAACSVSTSGWAGTDGASWRKSPWNAARPPRLGRAASGGGAETGLFTDVFLPGAGEQTREMPAQGDPHLQGQSSFTHMAFSGVSLLSGRNTSSPVRSAFAAPIVSNLMSSADLANGPSFPSSGQPGITTEHPSPALIDRLLFLLVPSTKCPQTRQERKKANGAEESKCDCQDASRKAKEPGHVRPSRSLPHTHLQQPGEMSEEREGRKRQPARVSREEQYGEGEAGSPWSKEPNIGLDPRTLGSQPELKAVA
ncbi:LOW QUALITY PROTEIN: uncharacterized protein LOC116589225 [Mustela erminea]|uniref:LOW QUALITY PROTEIN: uncharacterized protein LOC116589225 n=1 Tax=Mustela erminea TaxID=36723 RepID=UPI0013869EE2|nr:LOW QUALITY PROTEIN: uncharacterized protein LOC116589225 [Mustela erminea]